MSPPPPVTPTRRSLRAAATTSPTDTVGAVVPVNVSRVRAAVWCVVGFLVVMDFAVSLAAGLHLLPYMLTRFFDGDSKANFPTGAKTVLMLSSGLLALVCRQVVRREDPAAGRAWLLLALAGFFAYLDETVYLHQSLSEALQKAFHLTGVLKYSWTIVYAPLALVVGLFLLRGVRRIPAAVRPGILGGGVGFVLGAVGLEPVKSGLSDSLGEGSTTFRVVAACSDSLEMVGLALLATTILAALAVLTPYVAVELRGAPAAPE